MFLMFCSPCFAKEMNKDATHYSFATKTINSLGGSIADCDSYAIQDPETEWMCGNYDQDYKSFMNDWEVVAESFSHQLIPYSDWFVSYDADSSVDFYGKAYYFNTTEVLVAFDPSETGREVFICVSPYVFLLTANTDTYFETTPKITSAESHLYGGYDCKNFSSQTEAMQFFISNEFNANYDPYNLDADNDDIPCETFQNKSSDSNQCSTNESWVNSYVKKNGARVRGHCRKKR